MSLKHSQTCEGAKTELDLFSMPPTQTSIEYGEWIHYKPIASIGDDSPLEFVIPGHGHEYMDLSNTLFHCVVQVTWYDNTAFIEATEVAPVNNWMHSLFSQVDVSFNQKMVSQPNHLYPYRAYIENLLTYNQSAKNSQLSSVLYYPDTAGKFNDFAGNEGYAKRKSFTKLNKHVDMIGRLHCDVFNMDKFLINGVELRVKMTRSKSTFNLMSNTVDHFRVIIRDATLLVRKVTISPPVLLAHEKVLEKVTAKYPITRVEVKAVTIPTDTQSKAIDNLFLGQIPERIIIGFVTNKAANGDYKLNPFNFTHFNLNFLSLYVEGRQIPSRPLQPIISDGLFIRSFHSLFSGTGIMNHDDGNCISREMFPEGYFLHAFDLTPDLSASCPHWTLQKQGCVRLDVHFKSALTETVTCIVYAEYKNLLEIDKFRNIVIDYSS
jgi:hypothetical protein